MSDHPVVQTTTITGVLIVLWNTFVAMATALGWIHWDSVTQAAVNGFVLALVNAAIVIVPMLRLRKQVTPLVAPKDEDGEPLVRASDSGPTFAATRAALK